ncbi:hypothetical protein SDC9_110402 [bioreactor metagenome]|uniref:Uncharacterized protein n=1 Tax=bioreactor metagenome TaxID=1076179 RepID=A0A645BDW5_9ZZZZ
MISQGSRFGVLDGKRYNHAENTPHPNYAVYRYSASHYMNNSLSNCEAETCTTISARDRSIDLCERVKDFI